MTEEDTYHLIDAGEERKLEQIGSYRVTRQAAQAFWPKSGKGTQWKEVDAEHHRSSSGGGRWVFHRQLPESWTIRYGSYRFVVKLTDFGHIGLFPEQRDNWRWIASQTAAEMPVLNLFGYTGGSTLAAAGAGARVTHVDASRGVVSWARENAAVNQLGDRPIRWIVEDVVRYIERERKRGSTYEGLVLDPPSFGRGPRGQVWKIETDLLPLLFQIKKMMNPFRFLLLSCHTPGYSARCLINIVRRVFSFPPEEMEAGEMVIPIDDTPLFLPSGTFVRWSIRS